MANIDLTVRFTEEIYATRRDVMRILNTSLIDSIWRNIEEYRSRFSRLLSLRDLSQKAMYVTYGINISEKISQIERKFIRAMTLYAAFDKNAEEKVILKRENDFKILSLLANYYKLSYKDSDLHLIINGKNFDSKFNPLVNYYHLLNYLDETYHSQVSEDFLAEIFAKLKGEEELVSFYRNEPFKEVKEVLIGQEDEFAPVTQIEPLMNDLFDFINKSEISFIVKIVAVYYFFDYVKPFASLNKEVALIIMKNILIISDIGEVSTFIPIEVLLSKHETKLKDVFREVQKTNDLTYALIAINEFLLNEIETFLDLISNVKILEAKKEFHSLDEEEVIAEVSEKKEERKITPKVLPTPSKEVIVSEEKEVVIEVEKVEKVDELRLVVKSLLESNPLLRPKQAKFYASHRTIGKYYTIAMYQKEMNVVYETARTSMEQLVSLGYYRRESVKNKFVYTPVKK